MFSKIKLKKCSYLISFIVFIVISKESFAGWTNLNTGINDQLTGVVFKGNNGLVAGHKGIYKTNIGGIGASSWTRFNITGNSTDSLLYNRSKFNHAFSNSSSTSNEVYVCGKDSIFNKAVLFKFNLTNNSYSLVFYGSANSSLNKIAYSSQSSQYFAVGDSGLIVGFYDTISFVVPNNFKNNLNCINFSQIYVFIGSDNCWFYGIHDIGARTFALNLKSSLGKTYKELTSTGNYSFYSAGNSFYYTNNTVNVDDYNYYDFGPLNANCLLLYGMSNKIYVGTDHGIFTNSSNNNSVLEWFPTSLNYHINSIYPGTNGIYGCGKNGIILFSNDNGGLTKPFAKLNIYGKCIGASISIGGIVGSSSSCSYYVNGVFYSNSCNSSNLYWGSSTPGVYNINLYVSNGPGLYDTASQSINVVTPPLTNKKYTVNKKILCKTEPINISIDSSQIGVFYRLRSYNDYKSYGESTTGNGQRITFTSIPLAESGNFYLEAISSLATCSSSYNDTIAITIEKTKAIFYKDKINVVEGETVNFYQRCKDASFYKWEFYPSASIKTSYAPNVSLKYNSIDSNFVKLICWTANGCYDTIIAKGPKVYIEPKKTDSSFAFRTYTFDSIDGYGNYVKNVVPSKNGFFLLGGSVNNNAVLPSYYGDSLILTKENKGILAKYNLHGVLKWKIQGVFFNKALEDDLGNIYINGYSDQTNKLYDNKGDSILLDNSFIVKLDSIGRLIWKLTSDKVYFYEMSIDKNGNLISNGNNDFNNAIFNLNDSLNYSINNLSLPSANRLIMKLDKSGNVIWHIRLNEAVIRKVVWGENNQFYVTGTYSNAMTLYSRGSTVLNSFSGPSSNGYKLFLAKYDSAGVLIWKLRSFNRNRAIDDVYPEDLLVDSFNNVYISGQNSSIASSEIQTFENADSTFNTTNFGTCFIAKVSSSGKCLWIRGAANSNYGGYHNMVKNSNNEIAVIGELSDNNINVKTFTFNSTNGINITKSIYTNDNFICFYDSIGNLKRILEMGVNPNLSARREESFIFFKTSNNAYFINRNIQFYTSGINYKYLGYNFSNQINSSKVLIKFHENWRENYKSSNTVNTITKTQCDSFLAPSGRLITSSGTYGDIINNAIGGDSIITIRLNIQKSESNFYLVGCDSLVFRGVKYFNSGNYFQKTTNVFGCDSLIKLNIEINKTKLDTIYKTACDSFIFNSSTYKSTGIYKFNYKTIKQCDSIIVLNLKINLKSFAYYQLPFCDSISLNNYTYKNSGVYTQKSINYVGCDSIITFDITKKNTASSYKITACDSITINGIRYDSSGNFIQKKLNVDGCDSIINLDIQINKSQNIYFNFTACDSFKLNNITYSQSGLYKLYYKTSNNCDSNVYVNILINKSSFSTYNIKLCDSVAVNGIVYKNDGNYIQKVLNSNNCDSTINLTIESLKTKANYNLSFCDSVLINGIVYKETGTYNQKLKNSNNCDSLITFNLTKLNNSSVYNLTACNNITINNIEYSETGTYYQYLVNSFGCDSLLRIELTIEKINKAVNITGNSLIAQENNANKYSWINCFNNTVITNAKSKIFEPTSNGIYKVALTKNQCNDTSLCYSINTIGFEEKLIDDFIKLYPNPNNGEFKVEFIDNSIQSFNIVDMSGKIIHFIENPKQEKILSFHLKLNDGIYLINAVNNDGLILARFKFVVLN